VKWGCSAWPPTRWLTSSVCASANGYAAKLYSVLEKLDHGHPVLRIYCKNLVGRRYEKFSAFLRVEVRVNRMKDLGLNKGIKNQRLVTITDRFAGFEAQSLNVHVRLPALSTDCPAGHVRQDPNRRYPDPCMMHTR